MTDAPPTLKIVELTAENVKRIRAVNIRPAGNMVEITGRNGQGKSSVLDAIWWALAGTTHIQAVPIRKGANEAVIRLDLGHIKVTRTFKAKGEGAAGFTTSIVVESADGARFPSPQTMLDRLVGELSFDPLAFARMEPRDQFEALKRFVPGFDFAADQKALDAEFKDRADASRRVKELRARLAGIIVDKNAPAERIDDAALVGSLEKAGEHNADLERRRGRREQAILAIGQKNDEAGALQAEAAALRQRAENLDRQAEAVLAEATSLQQRLTEAATLPNAIDTAALLAKIGEARSVNAAFDAASRAKAEKARLEAEAKREEDAAAALTARMEKRKADRLAAIAAAKMPVEGIEFGQGEILLNGVPFEQGSDAERLRASIAIAMASNPRLRVIRVRDGSLLDDEAMRLLAEMATDSDYQVWIERVGGDGKVGFVIEDGSVRQDALKLEAAE